MDIKIIGTGRAVPSQRVTNEELAAKLHDLDTTDEWIRSHTGIGTRHLAGDDTAASDLALEAAKNAIEMAAKKFGESPEETTASLDLILISTVSPDYIGCPSTACIVQGKLGAKKAAAMDVSAGCTGFIYGLETAAAMLSLRPERKRALLIGAEILTKFTDWTDRSSCVLFGDGAGAVFLEKSSSPSASNEKTGLLRSTLHADGSGADYLYITKGGSRNNYKPGDTVDKPPYISMDGKEVYNFAVKAITDTVGKLLAEEGLQSNDIAWIIPHQANARIVQAAARRLKIPEEKFFLNIEEYANTSGASIPIALDELNRTGKLRKGDLIMFVGFGGGLTYGGNLLVW